VKHGTWAGWQPYIAVVALSVANKNTQNARKLEQLREETIKAEEAYDAVCEQYGVDSPQAEAAGQTFEGVKAGLLKFTGALHRMCGESPGAEVTRSILAMNCARYVISV